MRFYDPENSAGGGIASGRYNQAGKINGEKPDEKGSHQFYTVQLNDKNLSFALVAMDVNGLISLIYYGYFVLYLWMDTTTLTCNFSRKCKQLRNKASF